MVVWLEDQRIRLYKIEERVELRDVKSSEWLKTFRKVRYILKLSCHFCLELPLGPQYIDKLIIIVFRWFV